MKVKKLIEDLQQLNPNDEIAAIYWNAEDIFEYIEDYMSHYTNWKVNPNSLDKAEANKIIANAEKDLIEGVTGEHEQDVFDKHIQKYLDERPF